MKLTLRTVRSKGASEQTGIPVQTEPPSLHTFSYGTDCVFVEEREDYELVASWDGADGGTIATVDVLLNGLPVATGEQVTCAQKKKEKKGEHETRSVTITHFADGRAKRLFRLQCDLVVLSIQGYDEDGQIVDEWFSPYLAVKNESGTRDACRMIRRLLYTKSALASACLFGATRERERGSLMRLWTSEDSGQAAISSRVNVLFEIAHRYAALEPYFRSQASRPVQSRMAVVPARAVRQTGPESVQWLASHADRFVEAAAGCGMLQEGQWIAPYEMLAPLSAGAGYRYENRVVLDFLAAAAADALSVAKEWDDVCARIAQQAPAPNTTPLGNACQMVLGDLLGMSQERLQALRQTSRQLRELQGRYQRIFGFAPQVFRDVPRRTRAFQELGPYAAIYECIEMWAASGDAPDAQRGGTILSVKSLDLLLEYECLCILLEMLEEHGFAAEENGVSCYQYPLVLKSHATSCYEHREPDMPNVFALRRGDVRVTVYHEPVIPANALCRDDLPLFRATGNGEAPYTPDFILYATCQGNQDACIVLDAKYTTHTQVIKGKLWDVCKKYAYGLEVADVETKQSRMPDMVWILRGRSCGTSSPVVWTERRSPLTGQYAHPFSSGVVDITRPGKEGEAALWEQIVRCVPWLCP